MVRYEIVRGNYGGKFLLNGETGELTVDPAAPRLRRSEDLRVLGPAEGNSSDVKGHSAASSNGSRQVDGRAMTVTLIESNLTEPDENWTMPESRQAKRTAIVQMERQLSDSITVLRVRAYDMGEFLGIR